MVTIKSTELVNIAKAALYWYIENENEKTNFNECKTKCFEICRNFEYTEFKNELFIDELPF